MAVPVAKVHRGDLEQEVEVVEDELIAGFVDEQGERRRVIKEFYPGEPTGGSLKKDFKELFLGSQTLSTKKADIKHRFCVCVCVRVCVFCASTGGIKNNYPS